MVLGNIFAPRKDSAPPPDIDLRLPITKEFHEASQYIWSRGPVATFFDNLMDTFSPAAWDHGWFGFLPEEFKWRWQRRRREQERARNAREKTGVGVRVRE